MHYVYSICPHSPWSETILTYTGEEQSGITFLKHAVIPRKNALLILYIYIYKIIQDHIRGFLLLLSYKLLCHFWRVYMYNSNTFNNQSSFIQDWPELKHPPWIANQIGCVGKHIYSPIKMACFFSNPSAEVSDAQCGSSGLPLGNMMEYVAPGYPPPDGPSKFRCALPAQSRVRHRGLVVVGRLVGRLGGRLSCNAWGASQGAGVAEISHGHPKWGDKPSVYWDICWDII